MSALGWVVLLGVLAVTFVAGAVTGWWCGLHQAATAIKQGRVDGVTLDRKPKR